MLEKTQEIFAFEGSMAYLFCFIFDIPEGYPVVLAGIFVCHGPELTGQGKCRHEILNRKQLVLLPVNILVGFLVLAMGAVSVPAG